MKNKMKNLIYKTVNLRNLLTLAFILVFNYVAFAQGHLTIGTGTQSNHKSPMDRNKSYSTSETIYLQSEIGNEPYYIRKIAFDKESGTDMQGIENVTFYMKHTTDATLGDGNYSLNGYSKVFEGIFTNNAPSGWMEVTLDNGFTYNGTDNLQVLVIKGYQSHIAHKPKWRYTHLRNYLSRDNSDNNSQPTNLKNTKKRPNIRLEYDTPTHINITGNGTPNKFELSQNYPNPFNPTTKIDYNLPNNSKVTLKISDITGREIVTLVNGTQTAGYYTLQFDASNFTSGTYFYSITTDDGQNNFVVTKKMLLIK